MLSSAAQEILQRLASLVYFIQIGMPGDVFYPVKNAW